jgi:hypothetical protein
MTMATYYVKEIVSAFSIPTLHDGFPRRSAAEAWLIDYCTARRMTIICREVDGENDAIDFMTDALRQFAVEPNPPAQQ